MNLKNQIAQHFRQVFFGGNWTSVNLKDTLANVTWHQAITPVSSLNTMAMLVFHINYYVSEVLKVLRGGPLNAHDKDSFNLTPIQSQADWETLLHKTFTEAETFATYIEGLHEKKFWDDFSDNNYGNYYRNIHGIIEHTHYHLGQIVLIKKILLQ